MYIYIYYICNRVSDVFENIKAVKKKIKNIFIKISKNAAYKSLILNFFLRYSLLVIQNMDLLCHENIT